MKEIRLGDICNLKNGFAFRSKDYVESSNTLSCRMSNIRPGGKFDIDYNPRFLPDNFIQKYSDYLLQDGDIVIAMTDLANDPKILGIPTNVVTNGRKILLNQRVGKLEIFNSSEVNTKYLQYALNRPIYKRYYKKFAGGGLQINISKKHILNIKLPLPPRNIQDQIVSILDHANKLAQHNKELIEKYDELSQSIFLDMFGDPVTNPKGWDEKSIQDISTLVTKGSSPKWQGFEYISKGVRFVTSENVRLGYLDCSKDKFVAEEFHQKLNRSQLKENDILVNLVGASIGRGALVSRRILPANINQAVAKIELNFEKINPVFLLYLIITPQMQDRLIGNKVEGARANISLKNVRELKILYPSVELQNQFVKYVELVDQQKKIAKQELQESENLIQSLLQKAFKGELIKFDQYESA